MPRRSATITPQLRASEIARAYGFTSRHWIRLAAAGKIPGAWQPSGPGGGGLFDQAQFVAWREASKRRATPWRASIDEAKRIWPPPQPKGARTRAAPPPPNTPQP